MSSLASAVENPHLPYPLFDTSAYAAVSLRAWSHDDFLAHRFPEPPKLLEPIMAWGGICLVKGKPEAGKTVLLQTLAMSVAGGEPFLGLYPVTKPGGVVIVQVDMPRKQYQGRWRRLKEQSAGLPITHVVDVEPMDIMREHKLLYELAEQEPALVIVDSLRKVHALDEDNSRDAMLVCGRWRHYFPHATIVFLHHNRKSGALGFDNSEDSGRGSGVWMAESSLVLDMVRKSRKPFKTELSFAKVRDCPAQDAVLLGLDEQRMVLTPTELSPEQHIAAFIRSNPTAQKGEIASYLQGALSKNGTPLKQAMAYRHVQNFFDSFQDET